MVLTDGKPIPISIANKVSKSLCKIRINLEKETHYCTGFFLKVSDSLKYLITSYKIINKYSINNSIILEIYNHKQQILTFAGRMVKFFEEPIGITAIQINEADNIYKDINFLDYDLHYVQGGYSIYKNEDVFLAQFDGCKMESFEPSSGKILDINKNEFTHNCCQNRFSIGCPIILLNSSINLIKIIGVHQVGKDIKYCFGSFIGEIIEEIKKTDLTLNSLPSFDKLNILPINNNSINNNLIINNNFINNNPKDNSIFDNHNNKLASYNPFKGLFNNNLNSNNLNNNNLNKNNINKLNINLDNNANNNIIKNNFNNININLKNNTDDKYKINNNFINPNIKLNYNNNIINNNIIQNSGNYTINKSLNKINIKPLNGNSINNSIIFTENKKKEMFINLTNDLKDAITLHFQSSDQLFNYAVRCNLSARFNMVVNKILEREPKLSESVFIFMCGGNKINDYKTVKDNNLKDGDVILLQLFD